MTPRCAPPPTATSARTIDGNNGAIPGTGVTFNDLGGLTLSNMGVVTVNGRQVPVDPLKLAGGGADIISPDPNSREFPTTYTASLSIATRLPFQTVLETGLRRDLRPSPGQPPADQLHPARGPAERRGAGRPGEHDHFPGEPELRPRAWFRTAVVVRARQLPGRDAERGQGQPAATRWYRGYLDGGANNKFRPFPDVNDVRYNNYTGTSNYHSLQVTLSRQTGKNLQFFATYTFSKVLGLAGGEFSRHGPARRARALLRGARLRPDPYLQLVVQLQPAELVAVE